MVAILREIMLGYLSADIICSEKRTLFREQSSRKTVSYKEQQILLYSFVSGNIEIREKQNSLFPSGPVIKCLMSKDKSPSRFSLQMEAIVFIILQIFFTTRTILKIGEYSLSSSIFQF